MKYRLYDLVEMRIGKYLNKSWQIIPKHVTEEIKSKRSRKGQTILLVIRYFNVQAYWILSSDAKLAGQRVKGRGEIWETNEIQVDPP